MSDDYKVTERLYKTAEGEVVKEGDLRAAVLWRIPGRTIPLEEAEALGLVGEPAPEEPAPKKARKPKRKPKGK